MRTEGNNIAKNEILSSIRQSLRVSTPFDAIYAEHASRHRAVSKKGVPANDDDRSPKTNVELFRENLESVGGRCVAVGNKAEAQRVIEKLITELKPERVAFSDSTLVTDAKNSVRIEAEIVVNSTARGLFDCYIGVTSAQWAIAETGTLVLESDKEFNRLTSLIPEIHICLLEAKNIRRTMGEILDLIHADLSPAVTFITGPSRTSDIELTLAIGVHGPRQLIVIVIESDPA